MVGAPLAMSACHPKATGLDNLALRTRSSVRAGILSTDSGSRAGDAIQPIDDAREALVHGADLRQCLAGNSQRLVGARSDLLIMRVDHAVLPGNQLLGALVLGERLRIGGLAM